MRALSLSFLAAPSAGRDPWAFSPRTRSVGVHVFKARNGQGDRGREGLGLPSLRTVRAVLPHTALRLLVSSSGASRLISGRGQGEQPEICEEGVGPALVIVGTAAKAGPLVLLAQDRSQPSS